MPSMHVSRSFVGKWKSQTLGPFSGSCDSFVDRSCSIKCGSFFKLVSNSFPSLDRVFKWCWNGGEPSPSPLPLKFLKLESLWPYLFCSRWVVPKPSSPWGRGDLWWPQTESSNSLGPPSTSSESLVWKAQNLPGICQFVHAGDWLNRHFLGLLGRVGGIGQRFENKTKEKFSRKKM